MAASHRVADGQPIALGVPAAWQAGAGTRSRQRPRTESAGGGCASRDCPSSSWAGTRGGGGCRCATRVRVARSRAGRVPVSPFGFENESSEVERIKEAVCRAKPSLVLIGLAAQAGTTHSGAEVRRCPRPGLLASWISLSFLAGDHHVRPLCFSVSVSEWIHRLAHEPRRLFRRGHVLDGIPFGLKLLARALKERATGRSGRSGGCGHPRALASARSCEIGMAARNRRMTRRWQRRVIAKMARLRRPLPKSLRPDRFRRGVLTTVRQIVDRYGWYPPINKARMTVTAVPQTDSLKQRVVQSGTARLRGQAANFALRLGLLTIMVGAPEPGGVRGWSRW